ncbi:MAG: tetratricopeptide repeat protein [Chloroflexota bacterium]|nr:MAG: tetratricopeptide repeat protein [Chloroflexota bacterium]
MATNDAYASNLASLPTGTLTFLFSDVEKSTRLWENYPIQMRAVMARHDELIESSVAYYLGQVVRPRGEGDSRFAVFQRATDAVLAANDIQQQIYMENWEIPERIRIRIALHTGEVELREGDYYGPAVNRCARLRSLAHGGQTLLTQVTFGLVSECLPQEIGLRDLGVYTLKDLKHPERVYQLINPGLPANFPSLRTSQRFIENLPISLTSFVGREKEIAEVKQLLETKRLLTISGLGGAGKTRLVVQVALESLEQYDSGGWFIDLAPLSDATLVPHEILNTLGIREEPGRSPSDMLAQFFQNKSALMILDNCEQVLQGVAQLVKALIGRTTGLKILATSREPLGVAGETVWCIPSLSAPSAGDELHVEKLIQYEAVQLFVERALDARPHFALTNQNMHSVAQICARLDGIPLAIELAAARMKVLSVADIAARLDHRLQFLVSYQNIVPRQKTLRNLIDWSYELLPKNEQSLLRRLSVFTGGWRLEAAEEVCSGENIGSFEVLDLLSHLVDKSLVIADISDSTERYHMLETIRQYAHEHLEESGESSSIAFKHAFYFTKTVERSYEEIWGKNQGYWIEYLEAEHDNLRTAMEWMSQEEDAHEMLLCLAGSLWRFWWVRGYITEGRARLEAALRLNPYAQQALRANGLRGAGKLALQQGDYIQAAAMSQESLDLFREIGDKWGIARQLEVLGEVAYYQGDYSQAVELHNESLSIRKAILDKEGIAASLQHLGMIARDHGDSQHAKELFEQSLELFRELEDKIFTAQILNNLGIVEHSLCEYDHATMLFEEAVSLYRELKDNFGVSDVLQNLGNVAKDRGELKQAKSICEECLQLKQTLGDKRGIAHAKATLGEIAIFQGQYKLASELVEQSLANFQELGVKRGVMFCLGLQAFVVYYRGDYELATSLAEECLMISREISAPRAVAYCTEVLGLVAFARNRFKEAVDLLNEAIIIFDEIGDRRNVAIALINLARTAYRLGKFKNARNYIDQSLAVSQQLETEWTHGLALEILGLLQRKQGDHDQALHLFQESLEISVIQDNRQGIANCFGAIAGLAIIANQPVEGMNLFAAAQMIREEIGARMGEGDQEEYNEYLNLARQQLDDEQIQKAWSHGSSLTLEQAIEFAERISLSHLSNNGKVLHEVKNNPN